MKGLGTLRRFARDQRGIEIDYMLSLFVFIISLGFTFLVLTQYLDLKSVEVGQVNQRLACLRLMDDLSGSPGWMGGRTDWEKWVSRLNLQEKVNDESLFLGLRKNDRFYGHNVIVPGGADGLMQTASESTILSVINSLKSQGVICVRSGDCEVVFLIDTLQENPSIPVPGSGDNATTHVGYFFAGQELAVLVTDTTSNDLLQYDTILMGNETLKEGETMTLGGRDFKVRTIDQERVLLSGQTFDAFILPELDDYFYDLATKALDSAGVKWGLYQEILSGSSSSIEYALFSRAREKFASQAVELSMEKIEALRDFVPYDVARAILGIQSDFNLRITRKLDGAVMLDYGALVPVSDTARAEKDVQIDGEECTLVINVW